MKYNEILKRLAPCGLSCEKCFANANGHIQYHSSQLKKYLGEFDQYAERFVDLVGEPSFKNYLEFKELLNYFTEVDCPGCRETSCQLFKACNVKNCYKEKQVDFCFQCNEFPCEKTGFDEHLKKRWVKMQQRMKKIGIERFYEETKDDPHYVKVKVN